MSIDPSRLVRATALLMWAGFFVYLWVGGDAANYVGRRTAWVVPFGAIVLSLAALGYTAAVRTPGPHKRPSASELAATVVLVAPILLLFMVPSPQLGALAVERKGGDDAERNLPRPEAAEAGAEVTLIDLYWAARHEQFRESRGLEDGMAVSVTGLLTEAEGDTFRVSRFYASCCAADAIPYGIDVDASQLSGDPPVDEWVRVRGVVEFEGATIRLVAHRLEAVEVPADPYGV